MVLSLAEQLLFVINMYTFVAPLVKGHVVCSLIWQSIRDRLSKVGYKQKIYNEHFEFWSFVLVQPKICSRLLSFLW